MVRRLVQDQKIDFFIHQHTQPQAALLAAGEGRDGFEHVLPLEEEGAQPVPRHLGRAVLLVEHGVVERPLRVVEVDDLRQVRRLHRGAELDLAVVGQGLSQEDFEKRGLAGAVVAQQGDALPALDLQLHVVEERLPLEGLAQVADGKNLIAEEVLFLEAELQLLFGDGALVFSMRSMRC